MQKMQAKFKSKTIIFLFASFVSAVGDTLMLYAVPAGIGLETKDIRSAVLMWLVPSIAMFLSSFFKRSMVSREKSARRDYALLLIGLAVAEILISAMAFHITSRFATLMLLSSFIFFYALLKEGIPRLFYQVAVFRFFIETQEYTKVANLNSALNILAALLGITLASSMVVFGSWRVALLIDSVTFLLLGGAILKYGSDPSATSQHTGVSPPILNSDQASKDLKVIAIAVPLIFGTNALIWNYLPLLSHNLSIMNAAGAIVLIGILRVPGMIAGFAQPWLHRWLPIRKILRLVPTAYVFASIAFIIAPRLVSLVLLICLQGVLSGIYWPADLSVRNQLPHGELVEFNAGLLRSLSATQFFACSAAIFIYRPGGERLWLISIVVSLLLVVLLLRSRSVVERNS